MISRLACYFHSWIFHNFCFWLFLGERPYRCHVPECGRAFIQLSNLQQHLRNHDAQLERAKNRPFQCAICGKGFATESSLRTHTAKVNIHVVHFHSNSFCCVCCVWCIVLSLCVILIFYIHVFVCLVRYVSLLPCHPCHHSRKKNPCRSNSPLDQVRNEKQKTKKQLCPQ